jgi:hypothetical protein
MYAAEAGSLKAGQAVSTKVNVAIRVRPMVTRETGLKSANVVEVPAPNTVRMVEDPAGASLAAGASRRRGVRRGGVATAEVDVLVGAMTWLASLARLGVVFHRP